MWGRIIMLGLLLLLVSACGTSEDQGAVRSGTVSVFITDDLTQDYSEVWVTLYQLVAEKEHQEDQENHEVRLFKDPAGLVVNLTTLAGVGELLSVVNIPEGTYNKFKIKLAKEVKLVKPNGDTETRPFRTHDNSADFAVLKLNGNLVVTAGEVTAFAIDFDLSRFTINNEGEVVPTLIFVKELKKEFKQAMGEVKGTITQITEEGFSLLTSDQTTINVSYNANVMVRDHTGFISTDDLKVGDRVEVEGSFDAETLSLEAIKIKLENSHDDSMDDGMDDSSDDGHDSPEAKGVITEITTNGFVLDLKDADFIPDSNTINVVLTDSTEFLRGSAEQLAVGIEVEVEGDLLNGTLTASSIEIEGAECNDKAMDDDDAPHMYGEVYGSVSAVSDTTVTISIAKLEHLSADLGTELVVNLDSVFIKDGDSSDLVSGALVKVKGSYTEDDGFSPSILIIRTPSGEL